MFGPSTLEPRARNAEAQSLREERTVRFSRGLGERVLNVYLGEPRLLGRPGF
jgi:hypothetical protein